MVTTNQKPIRETHTKRERNPNITLKIVIKSQRKRAKEEETKKTTKKTQTTINKMAISTYLSIITLNVNVLNAPIKRQSHLIKNKTHLYTAYKKLTLELRTHAV